MTRNTRRATALASSGLRGFFSRMVTSSFGALGMGDRAIMDYAADMLARFARTDQLYRIRDAQRRPIETIAELLLELGRQTEPDVPYAFDRDVEIRRHCGDYALFMSGTFRAYVERHSSLDYYLTEGRQAYRSVAELKELALAPDSRLFRALSADFEHLSGALDYMRKVYMRPELHGGSYRDLIRKMDLF